MKPERLNREAGTGIHPSSLSLHPFCRMLGVLGDLAVQHRIQGGMTFIALAPLSLSSLRRGSG